MPSVKLGLDVDCNFVESHEFLRRLLCSASVYSSHHNGPRCKFLSTMKTFELLNIHYFVHLTHSSLIKKQVVKVTSHNTASPPRTDLSIVFARWRQCAPQRGSLHTSPPAKRHLGRLSRFTWLADVPSHTDHVTRDVCSNRPHVCDYHYLNMPRAFIVTV